MGRGRTASKCCSLRLLLALGAAASAAWLILVQSHNLGKEAEAALEFWPGAGLLQSRASPADQGGRSAPGRSGTGATTPPQKQVGSSVAPAANALRRDDWTGLLVVLAARPDPQQLQGIEVVVRSALEYAAVASRLRFRVVTLEQDLEDLAAKLRARLPQADVDAVAFDPWVPRVSRLARGRSSWRKELFNAMNFAAFYLHEVFPRARRALYLDTDVVVHTDLAGLADLDFQGHPAAAAKDCSQKLGKYVHVDKLASEKLRAKLPLRLLAEKSTCVANRGVVLMDLARWAVENLTGAIEVLVQEHLSSAGPLWRAGVSQPPFVLAIAGRYHNLGEEFNVRGLGRNDLDPEEIKYYRGRGVWSSYYDGFVRPCEVQCPGTKGRSVAPHISPNAMVAKVLHFNGRLKPASRGRRGMEPVKPPPPNLSREARGAWEQSPLCSCGPQCLQECAGLWWRFLPQE